MSTGRGSSLNPPNRFERIHVEDDWEQLEGDEDFIGRSNKVPTEYYVDDSQSIVTENNSPDIPFRFSINPFRGCLHGCSYCYARNTHEYLGYNAGLDFETKILVKHEAPKLFREFLMRKAWQAEPVTFSGVTDCYQPAEREFQLTRQCLEVALECRQPVSIVTKNALVLRDLDLLSQLAKLRLVHVFLSVTSLRADLARTMEPRTSIPSARLRAVSELTAAGVPVGVMVAPLIPGLTDAEMPAILAAASEAGARTASYILLRLLFTVKPVFREWLQRTQPGEFEKVEGRVRETRGGSLNSSNWGERMRGTGEIAEQINNLFGIFVKKHGLDGKLPPLDISQFQRPDPNPKQLHLF